MEFHTVELHLAHIYCTLSSVQKLSSLFIEDFTQEHHRDFFEIREKVRDLDSEVQKSLDTIEHAIHPPEDHRNQYTYRNSHKCQDE